MPLTGYQPSHSDKDSNATSKKQAVAFPWHGLAFASIAVLVLSLEFVAPADEIAYTLRTAITLIGLLIFLKLLIKT